MEIICKNTHFKLSGMDVSQIINKYHVGKLKGDTLFLDPCETIYLYIKGKIIPETEMNMLQVIGSIFDEDLYIYYIYSILKGKGLIVKREGNKFYYRKLGEEFGMPVILIKEDELTNFSSLYENLPAIFITIDEEQSITYFRANAIDPQGHADSSISAEKIGKLNNMSYVINSEPEWFGQEVMGVKILNEYESNYILGELKTDEDKLYSDLIKRHFIVKSGFKYGQNFRIYSNSMEDHAEYLVSLMTTEKWYKISRAIRLSASVRKKSLIAGFIGTDLKYIDIERLKDF
jgi:tRNA-intron endonuclease